MHGPDRRLDRAGGMSEKVRLVEVGAESAAAPAAVAEDPHLRCPLRRLPCLKLCKAVDLGFLDYSTRERRRAALDRELELNRRFAPDVYLGVLDLVDADGEIP